MGTKIVKLGDVAIISAGQSAPKSNYFSKNGIPFVRAGSLEFLERGESIDLCEKISEKNTNACKLKLYPANSILFAKSGMSANKGRIYKLQQDAFVVSHLAIVTPNENRLISEYLMYWLQKHPPKTLIKDESYPSIGLIDIANMKIELPSIEEQKKIAKILDKADEIRQKKKQANEKLDEFLKSTFIDMFGDPIKNNKKYQIQKIFTFAKVKIGPFGSSLHKEEYITNGIPLVNPSQIIDGKIVFDSNVTITDKKFKELQAYQLQKDDVVIGRRGEIGRAAIVSDNKKCICGTGSLFVRIYKPIITSLILQKIISSNTMKEKLLNSSVGVTMNNLNAGIIENLEIIIPPIKEQNQFAQIVENVETQKQKNEQVIEQMDNLFNALSQKAFKGEL